MSDKRNLARLMIAWGDLQDQINTLEEQIIEGVLEIGKTQVTGDVRATFVNPRKKYDYETVGKQASQAHVAAYTTTQIVTDWKKVCAKAKIEAPFTTTGEPSVRLKLE